MLLHQGFFKIIFYLIIQKGFWTTQTEQKVNLLWLTFFTFFRKEYELVKNFLKPKELRNRMKGNGWFLSFSVFVLAHASV
jgi:hypothetical protein